MRRVAIASTVVALVGAGAAVQGAAPVMAAATQTPPPAPKTPAAQLVEATQGHARLSTVEGTGRVSFVGSTSEHPLANPSGGDARSTARGFVDQYSSLLGVQNAAELGERLALTTPEGGTSIRYAQKRSGIPVIGGDVSVRLDHEGRVLSMLGHALPSDRQVSTTAATSSNAATRFAVAAVADASKVKAASLSASTPQLAIFDPQIFDASSHAPPVLVWQVEVHTASTSSPHVSESVLVDAATGAIVLRIDLIEHAQNRIICDVFEPTCTPPARVEGGPPTGNVEVDDAYTFAGDTYDFYFSRFGRDGIDGGGMPSRIWANDIEPNAHWDNLFEWVVLGQGFAVDDVVGHELTHGVTHFTSNLAYYGQSGAINESMSDIFGELVDLTNGKGDDRPEFRWLLGEELPFGTSRNMANPPEHGQPDRVRSPLYSGDAAFDPHGGSGVGNKAAFLITDGGSFNGQTITGIGIDKTAQIFYEVNAHLLASGSNWMDVGNALDQACVILTGTNGITAGDCAQVHKAVLATEMNLSPTNPEVGLPDPPVCPAGQYADDLFNDDMENPASGKWQIDNTSWAPKWGWGYEAGFATSGRRSLQATAPEQASGIINYASMAQPVALPPGKPAFVRFNHAFETYDDGFTLYSAGMVQYSIDGGANWSYVSSWTDNGYNKIWWGEPYTGKPSFGGSSNGYRTSRADLSFLAGNDLQLRFKFSSASPFRFPGWTVDDVRVFTCEPSAGVPGSPSGVVAVPGRGQAVVSWDPPVSDGGQPIAGYTVTAQPGGATLPVGNVRSTAFPGLSNGTAYTFTVTATNGVGTGAASAASAPVTPTAQGGSLFHTLPPARVLDSRNGTGGYTTKWDPAQTRDVAVTGVGGVPAANVSAVVLNVTVTSATAPSHLTVFPAGSSMPVASNLNFVAGQTVANHVTARVGAGGKVSIYNNSGNANVVADVVGYYDDGTTGGDAFQGLTPFRVLDTRDGTGGPAAPFFPADTRQLQIAGVGGPSGVPADATAVVLNVTAVNGTSPSHLTVYPSAQGKPTASSLNFPADATVANLVTVKLGSDGWIRIFNNEGFVHVVADVVGYYAPRSSGGRFVPLDPARIVDSRDSVGIGVQPRPWDYLESRDLRVTGTGGVPAAGASSVVLTVTSVNTFYDTHIACWPSGLGRPLASNLNVAAGETVPNQAILRIGDGGQVRCYDNGGFTDLIADVVGYFT